MAQLEVTSEALGQWDSSLLVFLVQLLKTAHARKLIRCARICPDGLERLLRLAFAVPAKEGAGKTTQRPGLHTELGGSVVGLPPKVRDFLDFLGDVTRRWAAFVGRANMRAQDMLTAMYECGVLALPIISLTSLLFGLILAFVGAVQLTQFGAQIYVAGLVGIGMLRVMGAIMVGVVMSGRVGAAYAALIGTMQVNEEVDALRSGHFCRWDFLVLPRVLALTLMIPLLTIYADLMGVLGGYLVGVMMLGLNPMEYANATVQMVPFKHVLIGLVYGTVFGVIIAVAAATRACAAGAAPRPWVRPPPRRWCTPLWALSWPLSIIPSSATCCRSEP